MLDNPLLLVGLPIVNAVMLCGIGLTLEVRDFRLIARAPKAVLIGLVGHYLLLPALGFLAGTYFVNSAEFAVGFVLLAACPSANVSNAVSLLARGNVALAVTLTAISGLITLVSVPFMFNLATWWFGGTVHDLRLPVMRTILQLALLVLLPLVIGMAIRQHARELAIKSEGWVRRISLLALLLLVVAIVITVGPVVGDWLAELGPAALAMCALAVAGGFMLARLARLDAASSITIGIEVGVQNCMLAMLVALTMIKSVPIAVPAAIYGLAFWLPIAAVILFGRRLIRT